MRRILVLILFLVVVSGCAPAVSTHGLQTGLRQDSVVPMIKEMEEDSKASSEYWYWLNLGRLYQVNGQYDKSIGAYNKAEDILTEYENRAIVSVRNVSASVGSLLFSKGAERYYGKGYERSLMHTLNGINYLILGKFEDAHVEMRKMERRQELWLKESDEKIKEAVEEKKRRAQKDDHPKDNQQKNDVNYVAEADTQDLPQGYSMQGILKDPEIASMVNNYQDPFSYSLSSMISLIAKDKDYAQVSRDRARLLNKETERLFEAIWADQTTPKGQQPRKTPGKGDDLSVTVVVFSGEAPALSVESLRFPLGKIGYTALELPAYRRPINDIHTLAISNNGAQVETLKLLYTDRMAYRTLKDEFPVELTKAIVRATARGVTDYAVNKATGGLGGIITSLASDVASTQMGLSYRNWEMLPNSAYIATFKAIRGDEITLYMDNVKRVHKLSTSAKAGEFVLVSYISENNVRIDHVNY
ncbi:MAG: hypothetical protein HQL03_00500 [Nitrospirae bacterium]|nr:hypothetical protein [Nitrospirota bacterium]